MKRNLVRMTRNLANSHNLCEIVNVTMKTTIKSYDMKAKISLSRFGLLDHILCEWRLVRHYFECKLFWVGGGGWDIILGG